MVITLCICILEILDEIAFIKQLSFHIYHFEIGNKVSQSLVLRFWFDIFLPFLFIKLFFWLHQANSIIMTVALYMGSSILTNWNLIELCLQSFSLGRFRIEYRIPYGIHILLM